MKINGRDVVLTDEEITTLKALRSLQLYSITYEDSETFSRNTIWE